ncbi:MAG TPA: universal stress protein [Thioalkalivibrio sp.]|nr:universal stress protein [Thioalkalivibrio sp.]
MSRIRTILAATDLSDPARQAVARAGLLAAEREAELELLHVAERGLLDDLRALLGQKSSTVTEKLLDDIRSAMQALADEVIPPTQATPAIHLTIGNVLVEIADRADALDASLLVVGAHGAGFVEQALLGSTAERLLRKTRHPLLVVRRPAAGPYRRVLVPVDFSAWSREALRLALEIAPQAEITVLHAYLVPFESKLRLAGVNEGEILQYRAEAQDKARHAMRRMLTALELDPEDVQRVVVHGDAAPSILLQAEKDQTDLIVMGKHGNSPLEELLLGSTTKHVLAESPMDVLTAYR